MAFYFNKSNFKKSFDDKHKHLTASKRSPLGMRAGDSRCSG